MFVINKLSQFVKWYILFEIADHIQMNETQIDCKVILYFHSQINQILVK